MRVIRCTPEPGAYLAPPSVTGRPMLEVWDAGVPQRVPVAALGDWLDDTPTVLSGASYLLADLAWHLESTDAAELLITRLIGGQWLAYDELLNNLLAFLPMIGYLPLRLPDIGAEQISRAGRLFQALLDRVDERRRVIPPDEARRLRADNRIETTLGPMGWGASAGIAMSLAFCHLLNWVGVPVSRDRLAGHLREAEQSEQPTLVAARTTLREMVGAIGADGRVHAWHDRQTRMGRIHIARGSGSYMSLASAEREFYTRDVVTATKGREIVELDVMMAELVVVAAAWSLWFDRKELLAGIEKGHSPYEVIGRRLELPGDPIDQGKDFVLAIINGAGRLWLKTMRKEYDLPDGWSWESRVGAVFSEVGSRWIAEASDTASANRQGRAAWVCTPFGRWIYLPPPSGRSYLTAPDIASAWSQGGFADVQGAAGYLTWLESRRKELPVPFASMNDALLIESPDSSASEQVRDTYRRAARRVSGVGAFEVRQRTHGPHWT